jgi:TP901 family phage tail tape measure protein
VPDNIERIGVRAVVENLERYVRDLKKIEDQTDRTGREMKETGEKSKGMGRAVGSTALGFAAAEVGIRALGVAAQFTKRAFVDFEQGIANAGAVAGASKGDLDRMTEAALEIGRSTRFSAVEATGAFEEMAAAGISVADIIDGAAEAAASLAAAGGVSLPMAADVMSTAMAVWGLNTDQAAEAANRLAGAANVSRFGVEDMALAVAQGGGAAAAAGVEFGDFTTAVAAIAPSFSSGSDAGTSFKTFLTRLNPESEKAREKLGELGIITEEGGNKFFDAAGNMKSMGEIAQILNDTLGPLTEEQRLQNLQVIFGTDAMRAAAGMMQITEEEFDRMSRTMKNTDASEVAAARMDTLGGRVAFLQSTLETMAIDIGIKVAPALKTFVDGLISVLEVLDSMPDSTKNLLLIGTSVSGAALVAVPAFLKMVGGLKDLVKWFRAAENAGKARFAAGVGIAAASLVALDIGLNKFTGAGITDRVFGDVGRMEAGNKAMKEWNSAVLAAGPGAEGMTVATSELNRIMTQFGDELGEMESKSSGFQAAMLGNDNRIFGFNVGLSGSVDKAKEVEEQIKNLGTQMVANGAQVDDLKEIYEQLPPNMQEVFDEATGLTDAIHKQWVEAGGLFGLIETSVGNYTALAAETIAAAQAAQEQREAIQETRTPFGDFIFDLQTMSEEEASATEKADLLNDELERMIGNFGQLNPTVQANETLIAAIDERLGDIAVSSFEYREELDKLNDIEGELTDTQAARKKELEEILGPMDAQKELLEDQKGLLENTNAGFTDNEKALAAYREEIERATSPEAFGLLLEQFNTLTDDQEQITDALGGIATSLALMETEGADAAIAGLEELKGSLDPEVWALAAAELGPALLDTIINDVSDPEERVRLLEAGEKLGVLTSSQVLTGLQGTDIVPPFLFGLTQEMSVAEAQAKEGGEGIGEAIGEGVEEGIDSKQFEAAEAARRMAAIVESTMGGFLGIFSPSRVTRGLGAAVSEGFALGILDGKPSVLMVIDGMVEDTVGRFEPIADRIVEVSENAMALFQGGLVARAQQIEDVDTLGRTGASMMDSLTRALETGSDRAFESAGTSMAEIFDEMGEVLNPDDAAALMDAVMTAMNTVITTGGAEGLDSLRAILASVRQLLDDTKAAADEAAQAAKDSAATVASSVSSGPGGAAGGDDAATGAGSAPSRGAAVRGRGRGGRGSVSGTSSKSFEFGGLRYKFRVNSATRTIEPTITAIRVGADWSQTNKDERSTGFISDAETWVNKAGGSVTGEIMRKILINLNEETKKAAGDTSIVRQGGVTGIRGIDPNLRGFETGTAFVPTTGLFRLHAGEMVVPARIAALIRRALNAEGRAPGESFPTTVGAQEVPTPGGLQRGTDLLDIARAVAGPRSFASGDQLGGGASGGLNVTFDMRGATLTGTLDENRRMMREVAEDVVGQQVTRAAFLGGNRR